MSNSNTNSGAGERSPRLNANMIEAAKAAAELRPDSVAKITSRYVDVLDWLAFDKALHVVQLDDDAGDLCGHAWALRLKIEDIVNAAQEAAEDAHGEVVVAESKKTAKVVEVEAKPRATASSERADRAVELRAQGMTLQAIADELGYASRQSVRGVIMARTEGSK